MESLLFALGAIAPIIITVAIGYILKKLGLMDGKVTKAANKLVFRLFLPCMLFLNVYKISAVSDIELGYVAYAIIALLCIFIFSLPAVMAMTKVPERRGALWQAAFRSNYALIGIPIAIALCGDRGAIYATVMGAVMIPIFNILAVFCLAIFSDKRADYKSVLLGIVKNPLIIGVAAGGLLLLIRMLFVRLGIFFRLSDITPVYKVLSDLSAVSTPLALLCLGANFEFSAIASLKKQIILGVTLRNVLAPIIGIGLALLLGCFTDAHFSVFIALFATPLAVSTVPMAQEMDGDHELAGQILVFSTIFSALSIFLSTYILRLVGIF